MKLVRSVQTRIAGNLTKSSDARLKFSWCNVVQDFYATMATSGKNPVSALQELMAGRKQSLPTYLEEDACGDFKCTVYAGGITAVGFGTTKKIAKQESAKNALEKLKAKSPIVILQQTEKPQKNYIGELNEFSSKKGISYPDYGPSSQIVPGIEEYTCTCAFWGRKASGRGQSKKDAKQNAAKEMLKQIYTAEAQSVRNSAKPVQAKIIVESQGVEELRSVFNDLTLHSLAMQSPTTARSTVTEIRFVEEDSVERLSARLRAQGIDFTVHEINTDPYVLSLKIKDTDYVFVENGDTREETLRKLLQKVHMVKQSGCSLDSDLIRL